MKKCKAEKILLCVMELSLPLGFWREVGISGLFPYLSLLNRLVGNKGSRREREDAHLLCYTLERQLLLALVFMATAQRLVGFLVLFLWLFWHWKILLWDSGVCWGRGVPQAAFPGYLAPKREKPLSDWTIIKTFQCFYFFFSVFCFCTLETKLKTCLGPQSLWPFYVN